MNTDTMKIALGNPLIEGDTMMLELRISDHMNDAPFVFLCGEIVLEGLYEFGTVQTWRVNGRGPDYWLDAETLRVLRQLPKFSMRILLLTLEDMAHKAAAKVQRARETVDRERTQ